MPSSAHDLRHRWTPPFILTWLSVFFSAAPYYFIPEIIPKITRISQVVTVLAVPVTILVCLKKGHFRPLSKTILLILAFFLWSAASLGWTIDITETLYFLMLFVEFILLVWLIWENSWTLEQAEHLVFAYILGTLVSSFQIISNFLSGDAIIEHSGLSEFERYTTGAINLNDQAMIITLGVALAIYFLRQKHSLRLRQVCIIAIILGCVGVLLTGSRAGAVCLVTTIFVSVVSLSNRNRILAVIPAICIIFSLPFISQYVSDFSFLERIATLQDDTLSGHFGNRAVIWSAAAQLIMNSPLIGSGAGTFNEAIIPYLGYSKAPHNTFIAILAQEGIIGLLIFALIIYSLLRESRKNSDQIQNVSYILLAFWCIASLTLGLDREKITWLIFIMISVLLHGRRTMSPSKRLSGNQFTQVSEPPPNFGPQMKECNVQGPPCLFHTQQ